MKNENRVWVLEFQGHKNWSAVSVFLLRTDAVTEKYKWQTNNPDDKFRVIKYMPIIKKD